MAIDSGNTFLIPTGASSDLHLSIVCTGKAFVPDARLLVNISSINPDKFYDPACIVEADEHPFIKHQSYVFYRHAEQRTSNKIEKLVEQGYFIQKDDVSPELLARIIAGFEISEFASPWIIKFLKGES